MKSDSEYWQNEFNQLLKKYVGKAYSKTVAHQLHGDILNYFRSAKSQGLLDSIFDYIFDLPQEDIFTLSFTNSIFSSKKIKEVLENVIDNAERLNSGYPANYIRDLWENSKGLWVKNTDVPSISINEQNTICGEIPAKSVDEERESIKALRECIELQIKKGNDYQNPHSRIKQADYYRRGIHTILDMINTKILRCYSLAQSNDNISYKPNFDSLETCLADCINYSSMGIEFLREHKNLVL